MYKLMGWKLPVVEKTVLAEGTKEEEASADGTSIDGSEAEGSDLRHRKGGVVVVSSEQHFASLKQVGGTLDAHFVRFSVKELTGNSFLSVGSNRRTPCSLWLSISRPSGASLARH